MSLSIYKPLPTVIFSGNPAIIGIKDSNQLTGAAEQVCIVTIELYQSINSASEYLNFVNGSYTKRWYFGTDLPFTGSSTLLIWVGYIYDIFVADIDVAERFNVVRDGLFISFIEREASGPITISRNNPICNITTIMPSMLFGDTNEHAIGIRPEKLYNINISGVSTNPLTELFQFFGGGNEYESIPLIASEIEGLSKTGDGSLAVETNIASLLKEKVRGHFNIVSDYVIYNLISVFRLFIYAKRSGIKEEGIFTDKVRVINAAVSETMQAKINELSTDLWSYLIANKKPLTWMPENKTIDIYAPELLYFPVSVAGTYTYYVREYFTNGTNASHAVCTFTAQQYQVVLLSAAYLNVRSESGLTVERFEVWVEDSLAATAMEAITYLMSYTYQQYARWFIAKNSLGAYECFRTVGFAKKKAEIDKTFITLDLPDLYVQTDRSREQATVEKVYKIAINTGPLSYAWSKHYIELLESEDVYLLVEGVAIPVEIESGGHVIKSDTENINSHSFEVTARNIDDTQIDLSVQVPIQGDFNFDFNESYNV